MPFGGIGMHGHSVVNTYLFTDIEGSTRLWERESQRMPEALASHDSIMRAAVEGNRGTLVKTTGDGVLASFEDPLDALCATLQLQGVLANAGATNGIHLAVRCGIHVGVSENRDNDFFGPAVNRAARIMSIAHGDQILMSEAAAVLVRDRLPADASLRALGTVRLRDLSTVEHVYQVLHPTLRESFPALRSLEATPNNLPHQTTSFIGRESEISDARKKLGTSTLLTLLGAGGIGKTRLSLQVAAEVLEDYPDGVWLVELAPLNDARILPQSVASVLGLKEETGHSIVEALINHVADRRLLLVLDNCEHVVQTRAALTERLMRASPHLRILASSREPLRVPGEVCFPVPALAVPASRDPIAANALPQYPGVRLFVERASAAHSKFTLTEENALAVAEICRRLDGIPLAIELAAARVRALSVESIAARLTDRFHLLVDGSRTALPRHQTLRALIDWSYDLLTETERILFRRLAVFSGGWTLEAAETVCSGGAVDESDVLGLLTDLIDKSLVTVVHEGHRYRLLETVRQYAEERAAQSEGSDATRSRHLDFFLALTEKLAPELLGPEQALALARLDLERENILSAHAWCLRMENRAEHDYRLVHAVKQYWFIRGQLDLGHRVTVEAVKNAQGSTGSLARCKALWVAGQISCVMGRYDETPLYLGESLAIARALGDSRMVVSALIVLTMAALGQGESAVACVHAEEALDLASRLGNKRQIATASNALAHIYRLQGQLDAAEPLYKRTIELGHELGDREVAAVGFLNLAMVAIQRGSADDARALLGEGLVIAEQTGSKPAGKSALEVAVGLAALAGDWGHAARFHGIAERQTKHTGIRRDPADDAFLQPWISKTRVALGELSFAASHASGYALDFGEGIREVRGWLATGT